MKKHLKAAAIALALIPAVAISSAMAGTSAEPDFTPAQQTRIGEIAADYLVAHPEILIEVSKKLQAQQEEKQRKTYALSAVNAHRLLMQLDGIPVKGPSSSRVIVTEFFDYECIACNAMSPNMEKVMAANPDVRFVFRDWTIFASRYPESTQASRRGLGIFREQGADVYMAYHNGIYRTGHNEGKLTAGDIEQVATAAGAKAPVAKDDAYADMLIEANNLLAGVLGLQGTPGIIVMPAENATVDNTTVFPGVVSPQMMQQAINRAAGK